MNKEAQNIIDTFISNIIDENANVLEKNGVYKVDHPKIKDLELHEKLQYAADLARRKIEIAKNMTKEMDIVIKSEYIILLANMRPFKDIVDCKDILIYFHDKGRDNNSVEHTSPEFMMDITARIASDLIVDMDYSAQVMLKAIVEGMKETIAKSKEREADINRKIRDN